MKTPAATTTRPSTTTGPFSGRAGKVTLAVLLLVAFAAAFQIARRVGPVPARSSDSALRERSMRLIAGVRMRLGHQMKMVSTLDLPAAADALAPYFKGVADTLGYSPPEFLAAVSRELERTVCAGGGDTERIVYGRLGQFQPALITQQGLRCAVANHRREDPVLWSLLDAWRAARLPKNDELVRLEATATHDQTRRRLLPDGGRSRPRVRLSATPIEIPQSAAKP
jgi:hypothetical protein